MINDSVKEHFACFLASEDISLTEKTTDFHLESDATSSGSLFLVLSPPGAVIAFVFGSAPIYPSQLFPICQDLLYEDRKGTLRCRR